eukprot:SAG31_NODE_318_length_17799_cov_79.857571_13_plen_91_part_00
MIPNPDYKGKWHAPQIDNPEYKGEWSPRQIENPGYFVDETPLKSTAKIGAIAIEIWTMSNGIFFDNMLVTTDAVWTETLMVLLCKNNDRG